MNWTHDWPTAPGNYWFHGYPSKFDKDRGVQAKSHLIEAVECGDGKISYFMPGEFLYRSEAEGVFTPATVPVPFVAI